MIVSGITTSDQKNGKNIKGMKAPDPAINKAVRERRCEAKGFDLLLFSENT
jgi:hypothetical protein